MAAHILVLTEAYLMGSKDVKPPPDIEPDVGPFRWEDIRCRQGPALVIGYESYRGTKKWTHVPRQRPYKLDYLMLGSVGYGSVGYGRPRVGWYGTLAAALKAAEKFNDFLERQA